MQAKPAQPDYILCDESVHNDLVLALQKIYHNFLSKGWTPLKKTTALLLTAPLQQAKVLLVTLFLMEQHLCAGETSRRGTSYSGCFN